MVTATVRDATHTLDGILDNQTVLPIAEHTTDTHGYTEMIFGAYDLLGLRFAPRIRDLDRQRLYRHGTPPPAGFPLLPGSHLPPIEDRSIPASGQ